MNKRQAKIEALELAFGILIASTLTMETDHDDSGHYKIMVELERIAASLEKRAKRLKGESNGEAND